MTPSIIEQFIQSKKGNPALCEDGLFVGEHFIAVVDGVTGKGIVPWNWDEDGDGRNAETGITSGRFARNVLLSALKRLPMDIDSASAITFLNNSLTQAIGSRMKSLIDCLEERPQAVIILYSAFYREIWAFGDCQCMINDTVFTHSKKIDSLMAQAHCLYNEIELILGTSIADLEKNDSGRQAILPLLRRQLSLANAASPYGYDVLDGFSIHPERTVIHQVSPGAQVILASDGYPALKPTLAESEEALKMLIEKDPLCIHENKGTKGLQNDCLSFDDRTYIRFMA